ncbi:MAG: acyl carrier protein [Acidimicrobiia bacterium]
MSSITLVRDLLGEIAGIDVVADIGDDDHLLEQGLVDSLHLVELVSGLEERAGVEVEADDLVPENFESLTAIAAFVDAKTTR